MFLTNIDVKSGKLISFEEVKKSCRLKKWNEMLMKALCML